MAVDLSGLKVGSAWRVTTSWHSGVLFVAGYEHRPTFTVIYDGDSGWDSYRQSGLSAAGRHRVEAILHELKSPGDITAEDLDGRLIHTADGGVVFFAGGHARMKTCDGFLCGTWGGDDPPHWSRGTGLVEEVAAYRNPPLVIQWQGECRDDDGTLLSAWCDVRGEKWRVSYLHDCGYRIYKSLKHLDYRDNLQFVDQYIRDHYASKDRAAST